MISVIIPMYNAEETIIKCIDSVLLQGLSSLEVIVVDDGSIDGSANLVQEKYGSNENIILVKQANSGVSCARNNGLSHATGKYVYFLDSDDYILPGMFESALNIFNDNDVDIVSFGFRKTGSVSLEYINSEKYEGLLCPSKFLEGYGSKKIYQHLCSCIFKLDLIRINSVKFDLNLKYGEDQLFQIKLATLSRNIFVCNEVYFMYSVHEKSAVGKPLTSDRVDLLIAGDKMLSIVYEKYPESAKYLCGLNNTFFLYVFIEALKKKCDRTFIEKYFEYKPKIISQKFSGNLKNDFSMLFSVSSKIIKPILFVMLLLRKVN